MMELKSTKTERRKLHFFSARVLLILIVAIFLLLFAGIAHEVLGEKETQFDQHVAGWIARWLVTPGLTRFMEMLTILASRNFLLIAYPLVIIALLIAKKIRFGLVVGLVGIAGFLMNFLLKLFFHRNRPLAPILPALHNYSFPSGHATSAVVFYGLLIHTLWKTRLPHAAKWFLSCFGVLLILLIGFSRVYLRMHFASDVIAGFLSGTISICIAFYFFRRSSKLENEWNGLQQAE